jgi:predicted DNA-binding antitoxin AbrB/MazE fold protein
MSTIEAIYSGGVFRPLGQVILPENQRVRLTVQLAEPATSDAWLTAAAEFQRQLVASHGVLPDCAAEIAADRRRHE